MTVEDELNHFELYLERQGIGTKMKSIRLQQNSIQIGKQKTIQNFQNYFPIVFSYIICTIS